MPIKNAICFWHREAEGRGDLFEIASPPAGGAYWRDLPAPPAGGA